MIRVLVADDSPTARGLLAAIIASAPDLSLVGEAIDGEHAVRMTVQLNPDLVVLDLHMPMLDGLAATREIMASTPVPILVVTADAAQVATSLRAIESGALDLIQKPPGPHEPGFDAAARRLLASIRAMAGVKVVRRWSQLPQIVAPSPSRNGRYGACRIVAIGTSTGGPAALQNVLRGLPGDFPVPVVIVQHMTRGFTSGLASWLNSSCTLRVKLAEDGERTQCGIAYIAPDDRHLAVSSTAVLTLRDGPPIDGFRPSASALFSSVAAAFGPASVAVILTGMGEDGLQGLKAIRRAGGRVIAQDEATSVVFGMPAAAIAAGLADVILPLDSIASRISVYANQ